MTQIFTVIVDKKKVNESDFMTRFCAISFITEVSVVLIFGLP